MFCTSASIGLFNPAGFLHAGHAGHAPRDCLRSIEKRAYNSVTSEAAVGLIAGFGVDSYLWALEAMVVRLRGSRRD